MERELDGEVEEDSKGDFRGDCKQDMEGDVLSRSGQVRSRSGLVQVWFSLQPKFNSFELDSEVGRLVYDSIGPFPFRGLDFGLGLASGLSIGVDIFVLQGLKRV